MTYDNMIYLAEQTFVQDEVGNQVAAETLRPVLCNVESVGRNEFYRAAAAGLRPEIRFVLKNYEFSPQVREVVFEGQRYCVIRTYATGFEEIELVCEVKGGARDAD